MALLGKIIHPDYGDITMDVARELAAMRQQDDDQTYAEAQARQALIAKKYENGASTLECGELVASIDARVHDYWRRREGADFWKHELNYMLKRHPEMRVVSKSKKPSILVANKPAGVRGKRGRWAA